MRLICCCHFSRFSTTTPLFGPPTFYPVTGSTLKLSVAVTISFFIFLCFVRFGAAAVVADAWCFCCCFCFRFCCIVFVCGNFWHLLRAVSNQTTTKVTRQHCCVVMLFLLLLLFKCRVISDLWRSSLELVLQFLALRLTDCRSVDSSRLEWGKGNIAPRLRMGGKVWRKHRPKAGACLNSI